MSATSQYTNYEQNYLTQLGQLLETAEQQRCYYANIVHDVHHENLWKLRLEQLKEKEADVTYEIEKRLANKTSEYTVVYARSAEGLSNQVTELIKQGWKTVGNVQVLLDNFIFYHQTLTR